MNLAGVRAPKSSLWPAIQKFLGKSSPNFRHWSGSPSVDVVPIRKFQTRVNPPLCPVHKGHYQGFCDLNALKEAFGALTPAQVMRLRDQIPASIKAMLIACGGQTLCPTAPTIHGCLCIATCPMPYCTDLLT